MTTSAAHASPTTTPEQVPALEHSPQLAYELTVSAIQPLGQSLVRLTFTSPDLVHFGTGGHPLDLRIKMIIPGPNPTADHFAAVRPGALLDPEQHAQRSEERRVVEECGSRWCSCSRVVL